MLVDDAKTLVVLVPEFAQIRSIVALALDEPAKPTSAMSPQNEPTKNFRISLSPRVSCIHRSQLSPAYGQATVPAVVPDGPGVPLKLAVKKPKSGNPTVQPETGSKWHFSSSFDENAAVNSPKSGKPVVPFWS
jgi:hypothetical protein